ncbi:MAG: TraX family protein [Candidatus Ornithomonoglobus sp.]
MMKTGLSKAAVQYIAIIAMVLDHASVFINNYPAYFICHVFGRMTIIIMSYFVAEGYYKTSNVYKYIIRMGVFAAISQIPFYLYATGARGLPDSLYHFVSGCVMDRNVIFTLFVGLCLLTILKSESVKPFVKALACAAALYITRCSDWDYFCLLWVVSFGMLRENRYAQMTAAAGIVILRFLIYIYPIFVTFAQSGVIYVNTILKAFMQLGGFLAIPVLWRYNGQKGNAPRLGFYVFYPAHLLLLAVIEFIKF